MAARCNAAGLWAAGRGMVKRRGPPRPRSPRPRVLTNHLTTGEFVAAGILMAVVFVGGVAICLANRQSNHDHRYGQRPAPPPPLRRTNRGDDPPDAA